MLADRKQRAVDLLFEFSEREVAEKLKISRQMLREWLEELEFQTAISQEMSAHKRSSVRRLSSLYIGACQELFEIIHDKEDKNRYRVILEILKVSGLLRESTFETSGGGADPVQAILARLCDKDDEEESEQSADNGE